MNERLKKLRRTLDLTQQEFADRIGSKRNTIAKYETDTNTPSAAVVSLICREFNVNEDWLRTGEGEMFNRMDSLDIAFNHFGYMMENATTQKKAVLSALVEMVYCVPDDKWDYIIKQFDNCLKESREVKDSWEELKLSPQDPQH